MKFAPQCKLSNKNNLAVSGSISTGLLIALAVLSALLLIGSYLMFSSTAPLAKKPEANAAKVVATGEKRTPPPNTPVDKVRFFADIDLDGDGLMTSEEYEEAHWKNFERCDINKDGVLERSEFPWSAIFAHDKNKDTKLDRNEYKLRYFEGFRDTDKNKDGVILIEEI